MSSPNPQERAGTGMETSYSLFPPIDYAGIIQEAKGMQIEQRVVEGKLLHVATMGALAPASLWNKEGITTNIDGAELAGKQKTAYLDALGQSIVATQPGGQRGCMDGRGLGFAMLLGPKTAGGSQCDPFRIIMASIAFDPNSPITYEEASATVAKVEKRLGFKPGGHDLGQCGAYKFSTDALHIYGANVDGITDGVRMFMGAVGGEFDEDRQDKITSATQILLDRERELFPSLSRVVNHSKQKNPSSCPTLEKAHRELAIVVFGGVDATVDNDRLIELTTNHPDLGKEYQAFGYNWGMHLAIAEELGGELGALYLQSVPTQDIPILTQLTDGSPEILAFQPN